MDSRDRCRQHHDRVRRRVADHAQDRDRDDPVRDRAGHEARRLRPRRTAPGDDRDRRAGAVPAAAGADVRADPAARRPRVGGARDDPGRLLPAGERLQHPHPPGRRRRRAVGVDDRGEQRAGDLPDAAEHGVLGRAAPDRQEAARGHRPVRGRHAGRDRVRDRGAVRPRHHHRPAVAAGRVGRPPDHRAAVVPRAGRDHRDRGGQQLGHLRRLHRHRAGGGVPARRAGAAAGLRDRPRDAAASGQHQGDDVRGRGAQRRARAAAGVQLLRRARRDGAGRRLVGHLGHHRRARGRDGLAAADPHPLRPRRSPHEGPGHRRQRVPRLLRGRRAWPRPATRWSAPTCASPPPR